MRTQTYRVDGVERTINFVETAEDAEEFESWAKVRPELALDTETTGLGIFGAGFRVRTVQFGDSLTAWVFPTRDHLYPFIIRALRNTPSLLIHNAPFDALALSMTGFCNMDDLLSRVTDTFILAHLSDPRQKREGGVGLGLKELAQYYVDPMASDGQKELYKEFHKIGCNKDTGWAAIDDENPVYWLYAGLDVILLTDVAKELRARVRQLGSEKLAVNEHKIMALMLRMRRRGILVDVPYTERLSEQFTQEATRHMAEVERWGVTKLGSGAQIAEALEGMGEKLGKRTKGGKVSTDRSVLLRLADLNDDFEPLETREPNPLAAAIIHARRATDWNNSYAQAFLTMRDGEDRLHAQLNALWARTARMSIQKPGLQTLPSSGWSIRRALIADPGHTIVAADYKAMEMRVLAALADVKAMKRAILTGQDLHDFTATLVYGPDFTKKQRKTVKGVGLGKIFGGGAATLSAQTGAPLADVQHALKEYDRIYPEISRFSRDLSARCWRGDWNVYTPSGRVLPVDQNRAYSVVNYMVQSTARDLLAAALLRAEKAGLGEYLLLPVHDEVIAQAPTEDAEDVSRALAAAMETTFKGVKIDVDASVYGMSWGGGYINPKDDADTEWVRTKSGLALPPGYLGE